MWLRASARCRMIGPTPAGGTRLSRTKMNRRLWMMLSGAAMAARPGAGQPRRGAPPPDPALDSVLPDQLLLKDYRPKSVYKIPVTDVKKPKFPAIDRKSVV